ncbi:MAG TPA: DNA polymerase III subunit delta' [Mycobacteriales bacterium]|nr:DNA polymerase III subunit delta' [Mycobacteriales bacterium]
MWADLVGQEEEAVRTLRQAAAAAAPAAAGGGGPGMTHAWLFTGPPGSGRSTAARAFAAALQCRARPEQGCGRCESCRTVLAGTHPDLDVVATDRLHLLIAEARDMVARAARAPVTGRWQVVLVEDADRMEERTSNTVLKAIEEPAPHAVWLLCAPSVEDVLPTIRSRCRHVALRTPSTAAVADLLVRRDGVDPPLAAYAARAAQGHVGRARRLATDAAARRRRKDALSIAGALVGSTGPPGVGGCLTLAAALVESTADEADTATSDVNARESAAVREALGEGAVGRRGEGRRMPRGSAGTLKELEERQRSRGTRARRDALDRALTDLAGLYRDVLVRQLGARVDLVNEDEHPTIDRVARASTPEETLRRIEAILACRAALDANAHPQLALEAMMLALRTPRPATALSGPVAGLT